MQNCGRLKSATENMSHLTIILNDINITESIITEMWTFIRKIGRNEAKQKRIKGSVQLNFPHILDGADHNHHRTLFPPYEIVLSLGGGVVYVRHSRQPQETEATAAHSLLDLSYYNKPGSDRLCLLV